jgi:hypothetical protein
MSAAPASSTEAFIALLELAGFTASAGVAAPAMISRPKFSAARRMAPCS